MKFTPIDLTKWPRGQMFYYFSKMAPTSYSLTVDVDVTDLLKKLEGTEYHFFPVYLWLVTTCINRQVEFKVAYEGDVLGCYDTLTPLYAHFHEDDKTFSLMWTEYEEDFKVFHANYLRNQRLYGENHGVLSQPEMTPPKNAYTISEIPWISFRHFAVHTMENKDYFFPSIEAGKFFEKDGRIMMPLSLTCHHGTTDGYHIDRFLQDLQGEMDALKLE